MPFTNVLPIFITGFARIISTHVMLTMHYLFVDKDNYNNKLPQKQLLRERTDYLTGTILHMWAQAFLQLLFPGMFFTPNSAVATCAVNTFIAHVLVVEPLYYAAHRWLHIPEHFKAMHSFHHLSVNTLPSTSLVQDFYEHFLYIATFGPALLLPYFIAGQNNWMVIAAYLVIFDFVNAYGHTNIVCTSWVWESKWSPIRYLFYTPEFHLGHHTYYKANYALFMPLWDHMLSTYRQYKKPTPEQPMAPKNQQDIVFIGHNGGLGHLLTVPEISVYNVYDRYVRTWLPISVEFLLVAIVAGLARLFAKSYKLPRYLVNGQHIGRIICVWRTPIDYMSKSRYSSVNNDIIALIEDQYKTCGTRYFGLGNLNKMKQLNDGGKEISRRIAIDPYLKDKNIRIWTGDTLTAASVYNQVVDIPNLTKVFYIGANGKIGKAVVELLVKKNIQVCIFSSFVGFTHPNVKYTQDLSEMLHYKYVLVGKMLDPKIYAQAVTTIRSRSKATKIPEDQNMYLLDYTVPFMPLSLGKGFHHLQVCLSLFSLHSLYMYYTPMSINVIQARTRASM